ncbi:MAG: heavy metal-binding domain-containing protein, partial [Candidatus Margulisiibacteriota bacterium]
MKNKYIIALLIIVVVGVSGYFAYQSFNRPPERKILYYQSGMHPWIKSDKPGKCPLCGMDLVPIYEGEEPLDSASTSSASLGVKAQVRLTKKQLENINVRTSLAKRRQLFKEIRAVGEVAYDPDLLVAEEEFVAAVESGDKTLTELAKRKLRVLGLSLDQISRLQSSKKVDSNLLLPESAMWVYADIYEHELGLVKSGARATIKSVAYPGQIFHGWV